jgi:hypothetical protein
MTDVANPSRAARHTARSPLRRTDCNNLHRDTIQLQPDRQLLDEECGWRASALPLFRGTSGGGGGARGGGEHLRAYRM